VGSSAAVHPPPRGLDKNLAIASSAYASFLRLKTLAEEERHILYQVFQRDQFVGKEFKQFTRAVHYQEVYRKLFLDDAEPEQQTSIRSSGASCRTARSRCSVKSPTTWPMTCCNVSMQR